jgi:hypothetical protein
MAKLASKVNLVIPKRTLATILRDPVKKHARHAGEIIWCWNLLNDHLFGIFVTTLGLLGTKRAHEIGHAVWNSFQSDKAQREMLLDVAKAAFPPIPGVRAERRELAAIKWLVKQTENLSKHRNDVAHVNRLADEPTALIWRRLRGDLIALCGYAELLTYALAMQPLSPTWPSRPRMLCSPMRKSKKKKVFLRRRPKEPPPPPES